MNENTKPLKWHKCMIYFLLWAGAAVSLIEALVLLSGANKGLVYLMYPSMQSIDIAYSLVLIALSAYQVYTRFQLAAFKRGAPRKLLLVYLAGPAALLLYMLIISMTTDIPFYKLIKTRELIRDVIPALILFSVNKEYYDKRKELFVN